MKAVGVSGSELLARIKGIYLCAQLCCSFCAGFRFITLALPKSSAKESAIAVPMS
jgi:hypothetical protein